MQSLADETLQCVRGRSRKFYRWKLSAAGVAGVPVGPYEVLFSWGRIGTSGQAITQVHDTLSLALWVIRKKRDDKLGSGYSTTARSITAAGKTVIELNVLGPDWREWLRTSGFSTWTAPPGLKYAPTYSTEQPPKRAVKRVAELPETDPYEIVTVRRIKLRR